MSEISAADVGKDVFAYRGALRGWSGRLMNVNGNQAWVWLSDSRMVVDRSEHWTLLEPEANENELTRLSPVLASIREEKRDTSPFCGETCGYCAAYDMENEAPIGPECGAPAFEILYWDDGRSSAACKDHGEGSLDVIGKQYLLRTAAIGGKT